MFTTPSRDRHKRLKSPIAQAYSLSSVRQLEPMINDCTKLFTDAMHSFSGQPIDFGEWLQWYAFDVIGKISFNRTLGFLENREDRLGTINALGGFFKYTSAMGQLPELHGCLLGNATLQGFMSSIPGLEKMNAFRRTEKVCFLCCLD